MLYRLPLISVFIFLSFFTFSQNPVHKIILIGTITDNRNTALQNVNVYDAKNKLGTTSDKNGNYVFTISPQPTTIIFSSIGFKTVELKITQEIIDKAVNDTVSNNVKMFPETQTLQEVEVNAGSRQLAYNHPEIIIKGYEFVDDAILLLTLEKRKNRLRLINNADKTLSELDLTFKFKPDTLYKDCMGNVHLRAGDSMYQINSFYPEITFQQGVVYHLFDSLMMSCVAAVEQNFFFHKYGLHNQSVVYYYINRMTGKNEQLQNIRDKVAEMYAESHQQEPKRSGVAESQRLENIMDKKRKGRPLTASDILFLEKISLTERSALSTDEYAMKRKFSSEAQVNEWYYQLVLSKPLFSPLVKMEDSIYIFNSVIDSVYVYDQNVKLSRTYGIYLDNDGSKKEMITDEVTGLVYYKYVQNGTVHLEQINLAEGKIKRTYKIQETAFPDGVKIKDGYAYYIFRKDDTFANWNLFKQKLE